MTDFTPTTAQVKDAYVRAMRNAFIASASEHEAEFDRWLAEHEQETTDGLVDQHILMRARAEVERLRAVVEGVRFAIDMHDRYLDASQHRSPDDFAARTATTLREIRKAVS